MSERTWTVVVCPQCGGIEGTQLASRCKGFCRGRGERRLHEVLEPHFVEVVPAEWKERAERAEAEAVRVRELYENAVGNRARFGWTINHLLECEEALRTVEAAATKAQTERDEARALALELAEAVEYLRDPEITDPDPWCGIPDLLDRVRALADEGRAE